MNIFERFWDLWLNSGLAIDIVLIATAAVIFLEMIEEHHDEYKNGGESR